MQLITDEYRKLNAELHETNIKYGTCGQLYTTDIMKILSKLRTQDVLDYGCGKNTLANNLPFIIKQYDPCIVKYSALPEPADVVVCTDVLEHVEPELLDSVMEHLASLTKKICYVTAATREAHKTLSDGRNAHLIVKPKEWWIDVFKKHFDVQNTVFNEEQVVAILEPKNREGALDA